MRIVLAMFAAVVLSVAGFCVALRAQPLSEADRIIAVNRAHDAGDAFSEAWNDWARQHDRWKTSAADIQRFKLVRKLWKDFDRACREIEY